MGRTTKGGRIIVSQSKSRSTWFPHAGGPDLEKHIAAPARPDVRVFPRLLTRTPARVAWPDGNHVAAICLDIGGGGLCLATENRYSIRELTGCEIRAVVRERAVTVFANARWWQPLRKTNGVIHRYGMTFSKISDEDWDWVMEGAGGSGRHPAPGDVLTAGQIELLLPPSAEHELTRALVERKRLDAVDNGCLPLIEYRFGGYAMREGAPYRRLVVRSKRCDKFGNQGFVSKVLVPMNRAGSCIVE